MKKVISLFLSLMMLLSIMMGIDLSAYAGVTYSGTCGENVRWSYNTDTTKLTLTGTGAMFDYTKDNASPWSSYASSVTVIEIPEGITRIGAYSFYNCPKVANIRIPESVTSIGGRAFYCTGLTTVNISSMEAWCNISFDDYLSNPLYYAHNLYLNNELVTDLVIPDTVTSIGNSAFWGCTGLTSVTIPDSVTSIDGSAFYDCIGLTSVTIPDSVTSIGGSAFGGCEKLLSISIPESVTNIGRDAFSRTGLTSINIPNSITAIDQYTFNECTALRTVRIPDSVTSIGSYAFYDCERLTELTMPCSAKINNHSNTFYNCANLEKLTLTAGTGIMQNYGTNSSYSAADTYYQYTPWFRSRAKLKTLVIEDGVESIGDYAFYECTGLTSIDLPMSVKSIGIFAFDNTGYFTDSDNWKNGALYIGKNLISVSTDSEGTFNVKSKTVVIADNAFRGCSNITQIDIPDSVKSIGNNAFEGCNNLTELVISDNVSQIGSGVLNGCTNIKTLELPCSLDYNSEPLTDSTTIENIKLTSGNGIIPNYTASTYKNTPWYKSKNNLKELIIDEGAIKIGAYAFYNNPITEITIPKTVTEIGNCAFEDCDSLETVYFTGTQAEWEAINFNEDNEYLTSANIIYNSVIPCRNHTKVVVSAAVEPTCSSVGYTEESYCSVCNQVLSTRTEIPKLEHTVVEDSAKEATCTTTGLTAGSHCSVCGAVITAQEVINANGHSYESVVTAPTCKEQGYTTYTCSVCGDSYKNDYTAVTANHDYIETVTTPATCNADGVKTFTCSICGDTYTEVIEKTGEHNYESVVTKPSTCTERGVNTFTCSVCGDKYISYISMKSHSAVVDAAVAPTCTKTGLTAGSHCRDCGAVITAQEVVNAKGHTYTSVVTAPTCKEQGYTTYTCSVCGDSYKGDFTAVTNNHNYKSTVTTPATCTAKGVKTFTCSICGDKYTEDIEMKSHTAVTDKAVAATCTKTGLTEGSHCSVCGTVIVEQTVIPAKQHQYNSVVTAPTCRDKGYTTYTCDVCGDSYRADYTDRTNDHDYKGVVTTLPTCSTEGVKTFTCSVCGDTYTEPVAKIAHTPATDEAVAPTGTSTGLTEGSHCSVCGKILVAQQVVPALIPEGASVAVNGDKAVVTLSDGSTITVPKDAKETVKNADGTYTVTLNDGSNVTVSSNTEITKTADGQINVKATDNGNTTSVTVPSGSSVVKSGDSYTVKVINGTEVIEKTVSAGETVVIDKSGSMSCNGEHKWDNGTVTIAPSYTAEGVKTYTCTVCGNQKIEKLAKLQKKANTLSVKAKKPSVKFAKLKKKKQSIALKKWATVSNAKGAVSFKKLSGNKKITVAKNGKITLKKGLKKGTYAVKIQVTAAGNTEYNASIKTVTVKIKVK